ncbi:unnamed protein product [Bursaphelenchus xylophilus]|uniref:(pine wood nematode) hypothetical protein n=1 Tax=Bursaphelenchus xylophilus TaxID=6326 RepID=A0A1I7SKZ0_BURXY|nr:unnamed protein product [Bursaphelenchus xylophilus]CAG9129305.1 unnamed protein product [Bursaphelenchus xylophilus]
MNQYTFAVLLTLGYASITYAAKEQFTTAPQCKCKDIDECSKVLMEKTAKCKTSNECEPYIKKIGNAAKIRQCLDKEQRDMEKLEKCVERKAGPVGCTNDAHPKNLTIPVMKEMTEAEVKAEVSKLPDQPGQAPAEMGQYLWCVDSCAMKALEGGHRGRRNSANCAVKLRCALAPPDQKIQSAFEQCEKELHLSSEQRFKSSCDCLKGAGVKITCPK